MLKDEIEKRAEIINEAIREYLPELKPEELYSAARHLIKAGGKRLRPVISLLVAEALGEDYRKILPAAVSVETIHNFTLVHDDIMDRDYMRRGVPTVHRVYGEAIAILAGDTLFAEAFNLIAKCDVEAKNIVRAVEVLSDVCIKICQGQYMDMSFEKRDVISEDEYLEMVELKTGTLIAASSSLPPILLGKDEEIIKNLWEYGIRAGIAFQIHDDVLDLTQETGKDWGSDLVKGKKTIIVIKAFKDGIELETFGRQKASKDEISRDIERLKECGAVEYATRKAAEYAEEAKRKLEVLPNSDAKKILVELTDYFVSRKK